MAEKAKQEQINALKKQQEEQMKKQHELQEQERKLREKNGSEEENGLKIKMGDKMVSITGLAIKPEYDAEE